MKKNQTKKRVKRQDMTFQEWCEAHRLSEVLSDEQMEDLIQLGDLQTEEEIRDYVKTKYEIRVYNYADDNQKCLDDVLQLVTEEVKDHRRVEDY